MTAVAHTGGGGSGASLTNEVHAFLDPPARAPTGQLAGDRKTPWLSPFLWPYVVVNGQQQYNVLQFSPEHFRFWGYLLFILILAIGKVITDHFSWAPGAYEQRRCQARADCPLDLRNPFNDTFLAWHSDKQAFVQEHMGPLQAAYGYINPCAYLDFPPANQILPLFWVFTMMCFCSSFFFGTIRCRADVQEYEATKGQRGISPRSYTVLRACCFWETFAYASFSLCFAVSPIAVSDKGSRRVMAIHTVPFILLELANWSHALTDLWYESTSGYLRRLEMPSIFNAKVGWAYVAFLSITTVAKVCIQIVGLANMPWVPPAWLTGGKGGVGVAWFVDKAYIVLSILVPLAKLTYMIFARPHKLEVVQVQITTSMASVDEDADMDGVKDS